MIVDYGGASSIGREQRVRDGYAVGAEYLELLSLPMWAPLRPLLADALEAVTELGAAGLDARTAPGDLVVERRPA
jgi:hypothetical protein